MQSRIGYQIQKITKMLDEEREHREETIEIKYKQVANLESKFAAMIEDEIQVKKKEIGMCGAYWEQARRESESKISRLIEDKFSVLRSDLSKESRIRAENINLINSGLEVRN